MKNVVLPRLTTLEKKKKKKKRKDKKERTFRTFHSSISRKRCCRVIVSREYYNDARESEIFSRHLVEETAFSSSFIE